MRNFQHKGRWKHILESRLVLVLLGILVLIFAWSVLGFWNKMMETSKNKKIAEAKITELKQEKEKLNSDISKLKTDEGVEESIRDKFGLAKDGEGMIVVVDDKNTASVDNTNSGGRFLNFLKNLFK